MMNQDPYQVSQGYEVLRPRSGPAYPIPCEEWTILRGKIAKLTSEPWLFHTLGSVLLGAALSALVGILLGAFSLPAHHVQEVIAWAIVGVGAICGAFCLFFAHKERGVYRDRATDVVAQMDLIEERYEHHPA